MGSAMCPGQDTRYWKPDDIFEIPCSRCGRPVEFFKTDGARRCRSCGARVVNPKLRLGCAQWCQYAKECLGFDPKLIGLEEEGEKSLVDRLIADMKGVFGDDRRRIAHALAVLEQAEELLGQEGGDPAVVLAAAILHDIGIKQAEEESASAVEARHGPAGGPIAERILREAGLEDDVVARVTHIVIHHHDPRAADTPEFRVVCDADCLVNLGDGLEGGDPDEASRKVEGLFKTETGKRKARRMLEEMRARSQSADPPSPSGAVS